MYVRWFWRSCLVPRRPTYGWPGIIRSQSSASTRFSESCQSGRYESGMLRQFMLCTGMKSTANNTFSFGSRITSELSE